MSPANQSAHEPAKGPWAPARPGPDLPAPSEPSGDRSVTASRDPSSDPPGELPTDTSELRSAHAPGTHRGPHGGDPLDEEYGPL
ncbi:hypothetical protein ACLQ2N_25390 [Streptomyces sp. DT224]|uniref:hypothetical protein n=1 Tax=Streptomyces sp. DT224 TaxID=3393426 RepID=UPI003CE9E6FF